MNFIDLIILMAKDFKKSFSTKTEFIEKITPEKAKEMILGGISNNKTETPHSKAISQERWKIFSEHYNNNCEIWTYQDYGGYGIAIRMDNKVIKLIEMIKH